MGRLFAGTPWDRPPRCERCGLLESECACPPEPAPKPERVPPEKQTARVRLEKRPKGKVVTKVEGLDPDGNDLADLAARLKARCGSGGTVKDGVVEIQGSHRDSVKAELLGLRYKVKVL